MDVSHAEPSDGSDQITPGRFRGPQSAAIAAGDPEHRARGRSRPAKRFDARQQLAADIAGARALIVGAPSIYIDTVAILLPNVPPGAAAELAKHCGHPPQVRPSLACGRGYPYRMTLQQPDDEALELVEENFDHIVSEFHVAIDLPTETADDADDLTSVIEHLRVQPWHGKRKARLVKGVTGYTSVERRTARNLVIYGDRPSKVTKGPCCHVEFRYDGARACKARGVRTCRDLLTYEPERWIDRDVKLGLIDWPSAFAILRQLGDQELRRHRRDPSRRRWNALLPLFQRTLERLRTPDHTPSLDEPPVVATQRQLEVMPQWSRALVSASLTELLRAYA